MTVLFLGFLHAETLANLRASLKDPPSRTLDVGLLGIGCFSQGDEVTNIHIKVEETPQLTILHEWAVSACAAREWRPPPEISGENYRPHITVFDGLHEPMGLMEDFMGLDVMSRARLFDMQLRAHPWPMLGVHLPS